MDEKSDRYRMAMTDVSLGLTIRAAASKYGLKKTTLHDHVTGKVQIGSNRGPQPILSRREEEALVSWIVGMAKRGFGVSQAQLQDTVKEILDRDGRPSMLKHNKIPNRPERKWLRQFKKRNPEVKLVSVRNLSMKRAVISKSDIDQWFRDFEIFLSDQDLMDKPWQIWNCDESGFSLSPKSSKVLGPVQSKIPVPYVHVCSNNKSQITVLVCVNAAGGCIPPYMLFPGKQAPVSWSPLAGSVDGAACYFTESGWMDTKAFYEWFVNLFIPHLPPARPVVLLLDSHTSHISYETFKVAVANQIHFYRLLPNASHLIQPCDVGLFGPLKQSWGVAVRAFNT
ncbi:uncharacterized protein [Ptychodera flava]|uniref:uncharacterized protein n=1 Tax=Ptychodera flava TaxID=63121 RepID=UPI00396A1589